MNLAEALERNSLETVTENGAFALSSCGLSVVDLFSSFSSMRDFPEREIIEKFEEAFKENKLLAFRTLFYGRNIRGGLGERRVFRVLIKHVANNHPELILKNMQYIPFFGRFDDLYELVGTKCEKAMWKFIRKQFYADINAMNKGEKISLLAKWLKSVKSKSEESSKLGKLTAKYLTGRQSSYRNFLHQLRKYLNVVENQMSANDWLSINYEIVPSRAAQKYSDAFMRHDSVGYSNYIDSLVKGEAKVNASAIYPYDILREYGLYSSGSWRTDNYYNLRETGSKADLLEAQWKSQPDYCSGDHNFLVVADTSGSMQNADGIPIMTSIGLAIYFAERNNGIWKNQFMTFAGNPQFVKLKGETLKEKVSCIKCINDMSTNIEATFDMILNTAIENHLAKEDMPKAIVIISDMQFNSAKGHGKYTYYEIFKDKFEKAGYNIPKIVFWNVNNSKSSFHAKSDFEGVQLLDGYSPSNFKVLINNLEYTPEETVVNTLCSDEYSMITL